MTETTGELIGEAQGFLSSSYIGKPTARELDKAILLIRRLADRLAALTTPQEGGARALVQRALEGLSALDLDNDITRDGTAWGSILREAKADLVVALGATPEPEWEYGYRFEDADGNIYKTGWAWSTLEKAQAFGDVRIVDEQETHALNEMPEIHLVLVRRPVVGWEPLPVGGDSK